MTETTCGFRRGMLSAGQYARILVKLCQKHCRCGIKVVIPCLSVGWAQELALLLLPVAKDDALKILIDGKASKVTDYYQLVSSKSILGRNVSIAATDRDYAEKLMDNDIILASSSLSGFDGLPTGYARELFGMEGVCVFQVGSAGKGDHVMESLANRRDKNLGFINIPLSNHASYDELIDTVEHISADCVLYVHGGGIEI